MSKDKQSKIISATEAIRLVKDGDVVGFCGAGGGITEPTQLITALAKQFEEEAQPKDITIIHTTGLGDRNDRGLSPLAKKGLIKRIIGGHWAQSPRLSEMAERNEIEAYNFPQGVICQLTRAAASKQPGILTHVGLGTFIDPDQSGGRLNEKTQEELVSKQQIDGKDYLYYQATPIDVAIIRGTTADADGYISMEDEIVYLDALILAQAAHNNGGKVIVQVQKVVKAGTLHPRQVKIPGFYVDAIVVDENQSQLYVGGVNRFLSGDYTACVDSTELIALDQRKVVGRRALFEISSGNVGNVGVGIADGIGIIAREEGLQDEFTLTVETGAVGGESAQGIFFGATLNSRALMDMPTQFDFYDGGGLDVCFLSFAEVDQMGNVNVHRFNGKIVGTGGFIDICQNTKKVVFCGTLTAGGLKTAIDQQQLKVQQEGKFKKFIETVPEITFNGRDAIAREQQVFYVTERAVFQLTEEGVELIEIAPGVDLEKDILQQMAFRPKISSDLRTMDARLFQPEVMGIKEEWLNNQLSATN
ncbi:acetate CoA-transferase YdiF [Enterococcus sp. 669A]|uniref:Acetate CoA-transferase YdiF n=1 Tax=Candidatus Enterococcus moelleringii TaxID=2815325 RepID=A0ABS3LAZ0_9ENTE|nr:CoA-transferase [Enterococcus sp. 669A]MBO1305584.1 acetate CoA-transferase YdiF [Enterococcus sp. 669A]